MSDPVRAAVIYYSSTGNVHSLAGAVVEGAAKAGAEVRVRRVAELAPPEAIAANPAWLAHAETTGHITEATVADLDWADVVLLGSPTRYGTMASQLKQFIDTTGPLWKRGGLAGKVYSAFTSTATAHGGQESTLLGLANVFYHWGGIIVPPGYTDPIHFRTGNPYGASFVSPDGSPPDEDTLAAALDQGRRCVEVAAALKAGGWRSR